MKRFLVTLIVVATLAGAFRVYSTVLTPLTSVKIVASQMSTPLNAQIDAPAVFDQHAIDVFPETQWTHEADQTWQMSEHVYLYFNDLERDSSSGDSIQISPVAIFWRDPKRPGEKPFRIVAERAQLKFQNSFFDSAIALSSSKPGRIVWASLEGKVNIDGPDGLRIEGRDFNFEEESRQLYSDHAVAFGYGPTPQDERRMEGTADQLQLTFEPADISTVGKDMPRVGGLAQVLLRRNVVLNSSFRQKGEPRLAKVRSHGSFLYDVLKREATIDDRVVVEHHSKGVSGVLKDIIQCARLRIQFESTAEPVPEDEKKFSSAFDGLVFHRLQAMGEPNGKSGRVDITSDEHQMHAVMQDLTYDAKTRQAIMIDQNKVEIQRGTTTFECPQIAIQHSPGNQLEALECRGEGKLDVYQNDENAPPVVVRWKSGVRVEQDPNANSHYVLIDDQALLGIPGQFGISTDRLEAWIDLDQIQKLSGQPGGNRDVLASPLPLKRVIATKNVRLNSSMLNVERSNRIDVVIGPGKIENVTSEARNRSEDSGSSEDEEQSPWVVKAETLNVNLIHDSVKSLIDFREVVGVGNIEIQHDLGKSLEVGTQALDGLLEVKGSRLVARNSGGVQQVLTIYGEVAPSGEVLNRASVSVGTASFSGGEITLSREENRVDIPGSGGMTIPIPQGLKTTGGVTPTVATTAATTASEPTVLEIAWKEGMSFNGHDAKFWGSVTAALPGEQQSLTRLLCEELTATLNQRISFSEPDTNAPDLNIQSIEAKHQVVVESVEYRQNKISGFQRASLAGFQVNLASGDFKGDGPGVLDAWTLGDSMKLAPGEKPQANKPAKQNSTKWRYSNVQFARAIVGNLNQSDATLSDRVEVLTAPVESAFAKFKVEQLSESNPDSTNAATMKCSQMRIIQKQHGTQPEKYFEVFATGAAELEGHFFRAVADELIFNERSGQFTLRGLGKEARLFHQQGPGLPVNASAAKLIEFIPTKMSVNVNNSSGISGSY
ncbi:hypothetical protein SH668x_002671 [Planctomicrobium sp. SH668]|uniref:hypothetical protein n=1 Tax=Planctomicrobium sp. SH668 TaxID=3448126 RepID=UPI003F5B22B8